MVLLITLQYFFVLHVCGLYRPSAKVTPAGIGGTTEPEDEPDFVDLQKNTKNRKKDFLEIDQE